MREHTLSKRLRDAVAKKHLIGVFTIIALMVLLMSRSILSAAESVQLGTAGDFAVLAGSTITNTGLTTIAGDVGLHPGSSVTGFGPGANSVTQAGEIHVADAVAAQAKVDLGNAYDDAASLPATRIGTELGEATLTAGAYDSAAGTFGITGTLTLDAENNPDAVFVFQMESTLTTASASIVNLINGANACNIFWQVGSSATLGTFSSFQGSILAMASITVTTGVNVVGRTLAREEAVTMDTNTITSSSCTSSVSPAPSATPIATPAASETPDPTPAPTAAPSATPIVPVVPIVTPAPTAPPIVPIVTPSTPATTSAPPAVPSTTPIPAIPKLAPTPGTVGVVVPTDTPGTISTTSSVPDTTSAPSIGTQETTSRTSGVPDRTSSRSTGTASSSNGEELALGGGPALPRTGAPVGMLALVGIALIAGGEFLRRCARYADGK